VYRLLILGPLRLTERASESCLLTFWSEHGASHCVSISCLLFEGRGCNEVEEESNKRGTAEQWIKEGKQAVKMTRLSCHRFRSNQVRLVLSLLAYNLGNLWRRLALPRRIENWSLTSLQQRLVKTGGRLVKHARYYWLFLAEGHLNRRRFGAMLGRIALLPIPTG
jgi:hypothetical protein